MSKLSPWSEWIEVCRLRRAPQDVAYSPALTRNMVLLTVLVDGAVACQVGHRAGLTLVLLSLGFLLLYPWLLLSLVRHEARYPQALAALAGTGVLFGLLLMPVVLLWDAAGPLESGDTPNALHLTANFLQLGLSAWRLLVVAHILRHAMGIRMFAASLLAIGWFIIELTVSTWLISGTQ